MIPYTWKFNHDKPFPPTGVIVKGVIIRFNPSWKRFVETIWFKLISYI